MHSPEAGLFVSKAEQVAAESSDTTVDHSDIRELEPHSHDSSGDASDWEPGSKGLSALSFRFSKRFISIGTIDLFQIPIYD